MAIAESDRKLAPVEKKHLLNVEQMARFVVDGYLEFDDLIPDALNERALEDELTAVDDSGRKAEFAWHITDNKDGFFNYSDAIRQIHELPAVRGVLQSLLGPGYAQNHSALHVTYPYQEEAQLWHVDSGGRRQVRLPGAHPYSFDILSAYFAHDVPYEMGPTLVLPGSHLRSMMGPDTGRYKNIKGQKRLAGKGGRICFLHEALWHCAQTNETEQHRFMFKIRYNPRTEQRATFNTEGWDNPEIRRYFLTNKDTHVLTGESAWVVGERARWWRYLCGAGELADPSGTGAHGDYN